MAIDATRNLPSFSEMYQAFKNRTSLGEALGAGLTGVNTGIETKRKSQAQESQSNLENSQARYYDTKAAGGEGRVPIAALPAEIQSALAPYVDENGTVPKSAATVALGTTAQGQKQKSLEEAIKAQQVALEEKIRHQKETEALTAENARLRAEGGAAGRELTAAQTVANVASKEPAPSLVGRGVSAVKEAFGGEPLGSVLAERQSQAALKKLSEAGGITQSPPPAPTPAPTPKASAPAKVQPVTVATPEEYQALPVGTPFIDSTGLVKIKGK